MRACLFLLLGLGPKPDGCCTRTRCLVKFSCSSAAYTDSEAKELLLLAPLPFFKEHAERPDECAIQKSVVPAWARDL